MPSATEQLLWFRVRQAEAGQHHGESIHCRRARWVLRAWQERGKAARTHGLRLGVPCYGTPCTSSGRREATGIPPLRVKGPRWFAKDWPRHSAGNAFYLIEV